MVNSDKYNQLGQSASALGAGLLGFGIGALWGVTIERTVLIVTLVVGAVIHIGGMYVTQMKSKGKAEKIAKLLLISAWLCLISLILLFIYLSIYK